MVTNQAFLSTLFAALNPEEECIATTAFKESPDVRQGWQVRVPTDPNHKALIVGDQAEFANTYYCVAAVKRQEPLHRTKSDVTRVFVIPLDDVGTGAGAKVSPDEIPLEPTYKIETSEGNWQYGYLLAEPLTDLNRADALIKAMGKCADEGGSAVTKLVRLPVGVNNKSKYPEPFPVRCTYWDPKRTFTPEQLIEAFGLDPAEIDLYREITGPLILPDGLEDDLFEWLRHTGAVQSRDPNPAGYYTITCPWAHEHTDGRDSAAYSPLGVGGYEFGGARQFKCQHSHCAKRGWIALAQRMFLDRFVLIRGKHVGDLLRPGLAPMTVEAFKTWAKNYSYVAEKKVVYLADYWLLSRWRKTADTENFRPDLPVLYRDPQTDVATFNTYVTPPTFEFTRETSRIQPILDHIRLLFDEEFENAMSFLAWTVHRPDVRVQFALLHVAPHHGLGRGWLKELLVRLLGRDYVKNPTLGDFMVGQFNEWLYRSLFVIFDEVRQKGDTKFKVQDKLREMITERRMMINRKNMPRFDADIYCNVMFLSNHLDALQIPDQDRRLWAVACLAEPQAPEYYTRLYALLDDAEALAQFYWALRPWLDNANFNPHGRAPITSALQYMREASKSELDMELTELVKHLRDIGVRAIYKRHFFELCRQREISLPHDLTSSTGGGSAKERAQFWAIMGDQNVTRTKRVRQSIAAVAATGAREGESEILLLDISLTKAERKAQQEQAEETALSRFLPRQLDTAYQEYDEARRAKWKNLL